MTLPKQKSREIVLQMLFAHQDTGSDTEYLIKAFMHLLKTTKKNIETALLKKEAIIQKLQVIDKAIEQLCNDYAFNRISKIELNVLRLAFYEIYFEKPAPRSVILAEALRLTKKFSSSSSVAFVNALLDAKEAQEFFLV